MKAVRQKWYSVACCPANVGRTLASLGQYIYAKDEESVYIHQFISSEAETELRQGNIKIEMASGLLQNGRVRIRVTAEHGGKVKVRIPGYAEKWKICRREPDSGADKETSEGKKPKKTVKGYLALEAGTGVTEFVLDFEIKPQWICANPEVKEDSGKVALVKGPMVYCLEEIDNGRLLSQIYVDADAAVEEMMPAEGLIGDVPTLAYRGLRLKNSVADGSLYGKLAFETEEVLCRAVPYCMWDNRGMGEMLVWQKVRI